MTDKSEAIGEIVAIATPFGTWRPTETKANCFAYA
jgi:hypothetical protein